MITYVQCDYLILPRIYPNDLRNAYVIVQRTDYVQINHLGNIARIGYGKLYGSIYSALDIDGFPVEGEIDLVYG